MELGDVHQAVEMRLAREGLRYTAARRSLVAALVAAARPLTIPELVQAGEGLAVSSAYRNLAVLETVGVVERVVTPDDHQRWELSGDLRGHHHHLVCVVCGGVEDFDLPGELEESLGRVVGLAAANGFEVEDHRLDLIGRCGECR
ncbi:MAG: hypothetical protein KatS3mg008_1280 [Acidimicrobiales bacterium]|nr:MAG: hypothetical protein KatS3mg008_1280 [Acidimicrobiales bacterium]